jgi:hypothetical protein
VVAGTLKRGVIKTNSTLLLGPDIGDGSFWATAVKSIHYKRMPVGQVVAGQTAALALKKVKRSQVRKGMVLVDEGVKPKASWEFDADIAILTHSTTIQPRYQAVIHCEIIRQAARVVAMDNERLRSGDRAIARFRFLQVMALLWLITRFFVNACIGCKTLGIKLTTLCVRAYVCLCALVCVVGNAAARVSDARQPVCVPRGTDERNRCHHRSVLTHTATKTQGTRVWSPDTAAHVAAAR